MPPKTRTAKDDKTGGGNDTDQCGHCSKSVTDQDNGISCDICVSWFHCRCQGVTDTMYKALNQNGKELFWFCKDCRQGAEKLFPSISKIQTKVDKLKNKTARVNTELKTELTRTITALAELKKEIAHFSGRIEQCERNSDTSKQHLESSIGSKLTEMETKLLNKEE